MEKEKRFALSEDELDQVSGGTGAGIPKRNGGSKVWCPGCNAYVTVSKAGHGGRTTCSKGHYVDEL